MASSQSASPRRSSSTRLRERSARSSALTRAPCAASTVSTSRSRKRRRSPAGPRNRTSRSGVSQTTRRCSANAAGESRRPAVDPADAAPGGPSAAGSKPVPSRCSPCAASRSDRDRERARPRRCAPIDGELGPAQAASGREQRQGFDEVGLAGAVLADERHQAARHLEVERGVGAEIGQREAGDQRRHGRPEPAPPPHRPAITGNFRVFRLTPEGAAPGRVAPSRKFFFVFSGLRNVPVPDRNRELCLTEQGQDVRGTGNVSPRTGNFAPGTGKRDASDWHAPHDRGVARCGSLRVSEGRMRGSTAASAPSSVVTSRRHLLPQGEKERAHRSPPLPEDLRTICGVRKRAFFTRAATASIPSSNSCLGTARARARRSSRRASPPLHPHRHQHVERGRALAVLDQGRRARIGEAEQRRVALELGRDVEQVAGVEADIERRRIVVDRRAPRSALPESGLLTASVSRRSPRASFTARPRSDEMVETRSTASANSALSTVRRLSLPVGMTR